MTKPYAAEEAKPTQEQTDQQKGTSVNQLNEKVKKGQAPKGIKRFDKGKAYKEQDNVHFKDGSALNKDGTWKHGQRRLTNEEKRFLEQNGWTLPKGQ